MVGVRRLGAAKHVAGSERDKYCLTSRRCAARWFSHQRDGTYVDSRKEDVMRMTLIESLDEKIRWEG